MSQRKLLNRATNVFYKIRWFLAATALTYVVATQAAPQPLADRSPSSINLGSFLDSVTQQNAALKAAKLRREAAELTRHKRDIEDLSPSLIGAAGFMDDQSQTLLPAQQGTETKGKQYSLGVTKTFITGTNVTAGWSQGYTNIMGIQGFTITPTWESKYRFEVKQPLWSNAFGHNIRLRHEVDDAQTRIAILKAESEARQVLIDAEDAYWTYVMQTLDVQEKADSLARVQKTRDWTAKRLQNGIADRADLLQVDSLLTKTKMGQLDSLNNLETARKAFLDAIGASTNDVTMPTTDALGTIRPLNAAKNDPLRIDIWIQKFAAKAAEAGSQQAVEMTKPNLNLGGQFWANARNANLGNSASKALGSNYNAYQVGLNLNMSLDFHLQNQIKSAAAAEAKAAQMVADKASRDNSSSWQELVRKHQELSKTISLMEELSRNLEAKLKRERERLELGRTITANVVNFEQELADARLSLLKTKVAQRKIEALSRMYLTKSEVEAL